MNKIPTAFQICMFVLNYRAHFLAQTVPQEYEHKTLTDEERKANYEAKVKDMYHRGVIFGE